MKIRLRIFTIIFYIGVILFQLFFTVNCDNAKANIGKYGGTPYSVLSSLFNNRMLLLLKGTYATDSPLDFSDYNNGTGELYRDTENVGAGGDPTFDLNQLPLLNSHN